MFWHFEHLTKSQTEASRLCRAVQVQTEPSVSFSSSYSSRFRLRLCQSRPQHSTPPIRSPNVFPHAFSKYYSISVDSGHQPMMFNFGYDANWRMNMQGARLWCLLLFSAVCFGGQKPFGKTPGYCGYETQHVCAVSLLWCINLGVVGL